MEKVLGIVIWSLSGIHADHVYMEIETELLDGSNLYKIRNQKRKAAEKIIRKYCEEAGRKNWFKFQQEYVLDVLIFRERDITLSFSKTGLT